MMRLVAAVLLGFSSVAAPVAAGPVVAAPVAAADPKPGHKVGIDILNVTGSGCKKPSTTVSVSLDNEAFTVLFSEYLAQVGVGAAKKDDVKDCRIKLRVNAVAGFAYAIQSVDHRGFATLAPGATASQTGSFHFHGSSRVPGRSHHFAGPYDDSWQTTDPGAADFGVCGKSRNLDIDTLLQVGVGRSDPATTTSVIGMDSADGSIASTYRLAWRRC